jgi:predicted ATPase
MGGEMALRPLRVERVGWTASLLILGGVLGTYRPVEVIVGGHPLLTVNQELIRHRQCVELSLELLMATDVAQYLTARFAVETPLPTSFQALTQAIHQRTDGHPLFMVTVVDALVQQKGLIERDGRWEIQGGIEKVTLEVPESLQQLVEQQLWRLSAEDQRVLEASSVTGMQFSAAAVAAGLKERVDAVEERCSSLARRGNFCSQVVPRNDRMEQWESVIGSAIRCIDKRYRIVSLGGGVSSSMPALAHVWRPGIGTRLWSVRLSWRPILSKDGNIQRPCII